MTRPMTPHMIEALQEAAASWTRTIPHTTHTRTDRALQARGYITAHGQWTTAGKAALLAAAPDTRMGPTTEQVTDRLQRIGTTLPPHVALLAKTVDWKERTGATVPDVLIYSWTCQDGRGRFTDNPYAALQAAREHADDPGACGFARAVAAADSLAVHYASPPGSRIAGCGARLIAPHPRTDHRREVTCPECFDQLRIP